MTGLPAASADAVSPPHAPNANGKLLAPNTATTPRGTSIRRRSGFGSDWRFGSARSITASTHDPPRTILRTCEAEHTCVLVRRSAAVGATPSPTHHAPTGH